VVDGTLLGLAASGLRGVTSLIRVNDEWTYGGWNHRSARRWWMELYEALRGVTNLLV
jgi:hypothetical protein